MPLVANPPAIHAAITARQSAPVTILSEISRLNREIESCDHALLIAKRLEGRHAIPERDVQAVRLRRDRAKRELGWLVSASNQPR